MIRTISLIRVLGLALAVVMGMATVAQADGGVPLPQPAKAFKGDKCVEPADVMRRDHMTFLKHQRDETLREGIRGQKYSLKECVECHAVTSPDVANGKIRTVKPFCKECHSYAAVSIDCFSCHTGAASSDKRTGSIANPHTGNTLIGEIEAHLGAKQEARP